MADDGKLIFTFINIVILTWILFFYKGSRFSIQRKKINKKKEDLKRLNLNKIIYLCEGADDLGDGLLQFYGEPAGENIRPGMNIVSTNGREYRITEVYADDDTPDKPDSEITVGMESTAVVVELNGGNWSDIRQSLKENGVIALEVH